MTALQSITERMAELQAELDDINAKRIAGVDNNAPWNERFIKAAAASEAWRKLNPDLAKRRDDLITQLNRLETDLEIIRRKDLLLQSLEQAGLAPREVAALESLEETPAIAAARHLFDPGHLNFLLLIGVPGSGKTIAAAAVIRNALRRRIRAQFCRATETASLPAYGEEAQRRLNHLRSIPVLVLDDLGAEAMNPMWHQALEDIIDSRYRTKLRTVLTSNLDVKGFRDRYGTRIADRIKHDGTVVIAGDKSMRVRK